MKPDVHNFPRRLECIEEAIENYNLTKRERTRILDFRDQCLASGLSIARTVKYLQEVKLLYDRGLYRILRVRKSGVNPLLAEIERSDLSAWTKHDYKLALRKYLVFLGKQDLADQIKLKPVHGEKLPEELLTPEDVRELLERSHRLEDRAFLLALWESGCRIGELLNLQRKRISFDHLGAVILVEGKTGMRRVRLMESAPVLDEWISNRSFKQDQRIFPNTYRAYTKRLQELCRRADIGKRIYPHLFRHSRATYLASYLTEIQLCIFMGWTVGSTMARIYVHLNGADLDAALVHVPALMTTAPSSVDSCQARVPARNPSPR
jgi:integrase/recombinase XerD